MAEGGALLRRYTGLNPYRGFESLSLRHTPSVSTARRGAIACIAAAALVGAVVPAAAETSGQFWPELDGYFSLSERTRLFLMATAAMRSRCRDNPGACRDRTCKSACTST